MECPSATTLSDFLAGLLPADQRATLVAHVERCARCQQALAAGASSRPAPLGVKADTTLGPGSTLSRYVVIERIGMGAMGVVYSAHDPQLNRRVALKLLRSDGRHVEELRARLLREAQALARLSHPNVVTIHDVGTCADGIFLAMDLVEGSTLAQWLREPRSWPQVLRVFREAGRGLEAAHAAGIIHRDFKPANVLVGHNGQVRVMDFGLASTSGEAGALPPSAGPPGAGLAADASPELTVTGALVGTPAYMAPEQLSRGASELSDQFSFCVALYEALYGHRPFKGHTAQELFRAALAGEVTRPDPRAKVPAWVGRAVLGGLRVRPEERFPSMNALLEALTPRPRARWAAAIAVAAGALAAVLGYRATHRYEARCAQEAGKLTAVWSPAHRERARAAFFATGMSTAGPIWEKVSAALDDYASRWSALRTQACVLAAGDTSSTAWQTASCLDNRLWQLAAVTDALAKADAQTVSNAPQMMASLEGLSGCQDAPMLSTRPQPPDALRPRVDAVRRRLAEAQALQELNKHAEGRAITQVLLQELPSISFRPLEAEVLALHGGFLMRTGQPQEAERVLQQALLAAEAGRDDEMAARAWILLIRIQGFVLGRMEEAKRSAQHARAVLERLGRERHPALTSELHQCLGDLELLQFHLDAAETELNEALALARKTFGPEHPRVAKLLAALGRVRSRQFRSEEALALYLQANSVWERATGPDSAPIAVNLTNIAGEMQILGRLDEALAQYQRALYLLELYRFPDPLALASTRVNFATLLLAVGRVEEARRYDRQALAVYESTQGRAHPNTLLTLAALGMVELEAQRTEEAIRYQREALARIQGSPEPDGPLSAIPLEYLGRAYTQAGRFGEASKQFQRALDVLEKQHGPDNAPQTSVRRGRGRLELTSGAPRAALADCQRALALDEQAQGADVPDVALDLACLGEAHLALGAVSQAVPLLERARDIHQHAPQDRREEAWAYFLLAQGLWKRHAPADPARALALAEEARALLAPQQPRGQPELRQVTAWLAQRQVARRTP